MAEYFQDSILEEQNASQIEFLHNMNRTLKKEFEAWESRFCVEGRRSYKIAGINLQGLKKFSGAFQGKIQHEGWNAFDPYAVAIYSGKKKIGYISKDDSQAVYQMLSDKAIDGGCYGCIYTQYNVSDDYDKNMEMQIFLVGRIVLTPL